MAIAAPFFKHINKFFPTAQVAKGIPEDLVNTFDTLLSSYRKADDLLETGSTGYKPLHEQGPLSSLDLQTDYLDKAKIRQFSGALYQKQRFNQLKDQFSKYSTREWRNTKEAVGHFGKYFSELTKRSDQSSQRFYESSVSVFAENLQKSKNGKYNSEAFKSFFYTPKKAERLFGVSQKEIYLSLFHKGNVAAGKNPAQTAFLDSIGKAYKQMDDNYLNAFQSLTNMGKLKNFVLPVQLNHPFLTSIPDEDLAKLFMKHTNFTDEKELKVLVSRMKQNATKKPGEKTISDKTIQFYERNIKFNSPEDEFDFISKITGLEEHDESLLVKVFSHKERLSNNSFLYKDFGANPEKTVDKIFRSTLRENKDKFKISDEQINKLELSDNFEKDFDDLFKGNKELDKLKKSRAYALKTLEMAQGKGYAVDSTMRFYSEALDKFTSAIFGATKSILRQGLLDASAHPATIESAILNKKSIPGFYFQRVYNPFATIMLNAQRQIKKDPTIRNNLNSLLHLFNFSGSNNVLFRQFGFKMENFIGTEGMASGAAKNKAAQFGLTLDSMASKMNEFLHKYTGNMAHYDSVNAINLINSSAYFTETILKGPNNWKDIFDSWGNLGKYVRDFYDLDIKDFQAISKLNPEEIPMNETSRALGFKDKVKVITPDNIRKMSDEIAEKFKRTGETNKAFKDRIALSYYQLLSDQTHYGQVSLSKSNRFVERYMKRGTFADLMLRPFTKFWNITNEQYMGLQKGISIGLYGGPFDANISHAISNQQVFEQWAKGFGWYMGAGLGVMWLKDLLDGRTPRKLDRNTMFRVMSNSGVGGVPMSILGQMMDTPNRSIYGGTPFGSYLSKMGAASKNSYRFGKFIQQTSGVGKMWWTDGMVNNILKNSLLGNKDEARLNNWYKTHLGSNFIVQ